MAYQDWQNLLNAGPPWTDRAGVALASATTATLTPQPDVFTNQPFQVGQVFRTTGMGTLTTTATSTGLTVFLAAKTVSGTFVTLATAASITTGTTALAGIQWSFSSLSYVTAVNATGATISTTGQISYGLVVAATPTLPPSPQLLTASSVGMDMYLPATGGMTAASVDTTQAQAIVIRATSTVAGPSIQCNQYLLEQLN